MLSNPPPTITSLKQSFLDSQIRLLSRPPEPTPAWKSENASSDSPLRQSSIDEALFRLNQTLQQHSRRAYPPQSTRLVAEQIDKLYSEAATLDSGLAPKDGIDVAADLTNEETISTLPDNFPSESTPRDPNDPSPARYQDLKSQLTALSSERSTLQSRLHRIRRIQAVLAPFDPPNETTSDVNPEDNPDADTGMGGIQENLITRGSQVEKELERMRVLLARVSGRVAALPQSQSDESSQIAMSIDPPAEEKRKVEDLLNRF